jgi:hypothetical protein
MDITGIAKSHHADIPKASSKKEWKLSDSLREKIYSFKKLLDYNMKSDKIKVIKKCSS